MTDVRLDEDQVAKELADISKFADKNQRLSWRRKKTRMETLLRELEPLNEEALQLVLKKQPILDKIQVVRQKMILECVHPLDYLVHRGRHILCKFCGNKIHPKR